MDIAVTDQLTIANIATFKEHISTQLKDNTEIVLDLCNLESIDVTGIQLLLSLLGKQGTPPGKFSLANPNDVFTSTVAGYGLSQQFA